MNKTLQLSRADQRYFILEFRVLAKVAQRSNIDKTQKYSLLGLSQVSWMGGRKNVRLGRTNMGKSNVDIHLTRQLQSSTNALLSAPPRNRIIDSRSPTHCTHSFDCASMQASIPRSDISAIVLATATLFSQFISPSMPRKIPLRPHYPATEAFETSSQVIYNSITVSKNSHGCFRCKAYLLWGSSDESLSAN
jgi:hypothetical protein